MIPLEDYDVIVEEGKNANVSDKNKIINGIIV